MQFQVVEYAGESSAFGGWGTFTAALLEAVAVAVHFQDVDVVGAPVQQGACLGQRHEAQLIDDEQFVAVGSTMSRMLRQPELTL